MDHRQKRAGILLVARGNPPEMLDPVEKALHPVALPVDCLVVGYLLLPVGFRMYDRLDAVKRQTFTNGIAVVAFVQCGGLQHVVPVQICKEFFELAAICALTGTEDQADTGYLVHAGGVDLGGKSSPRASRSLIAAFFLGAPAAC